MGILRPDSDSTQLGRRDQHAPLTSPTERAAMIGGAVLVALIGCWHLALCATSDLRIGQLSATFYGLFRAEPLAGLRHAGVTPPSPAAAGAVFGLLLAGLTAVTVLVIVWQLRRRDKKPGKGLATRDDAQRQAGEAAVRASGAYTRAATYALPNGQPDRKAIARAPLREFGYELGRLRADRTRLFLSHDTSAGVLGVTRSGKTRGFVVPACLEAVGPLVVTSTRADVLDVIAAPMMRRGRIWVFDPLGSVGWPEPMVWDPVFGCVDGQAAMARGEAFVSGVASNSGESAKNEGFFRDAATTAMQCLMHAAALDERPMEHVLGWAIELANAEAPRRILKSNPSAIRMWDKMLLSVATGADETVSSTRTTLSNRLRKLMLPEVIACLTPRAGVPVFNADQFVRSTDTIMLICDNNAPANVSPLTTMLFGELIEAAKRAGRLAPGGRLDPPIRFVCDEIANIAPLPSFPAMLSDSLGLGIQLMWALQSLSQAEGAWQKLGTQTLLNNTICKIIFGGISDSETLDKIAGMLGPVDVTQLQTSYGNQMAGGQGFGQWGPSYSESAHEKRVLTPKEIRELGADGSPTALAVWGRSPGMVLDVPAWTTRRDGQQLQADARLTTARRSGR